VGDGVVGRSGVAAGGRGAAGGGVGGSRARVGALVALWGAVVCAFASMSGCYGRNCEGDVQDWGNNPGEGSLVDENTWQSTPIDGKWLHYPMQRAWIFAARDLGDRTPYEISVMVSAQEDPVHEGSAAPAAGNLAEISGIVGGQFVVKNGTCAEYFVRVVARASPRPGPAPTPGEDAGGGGDAAGGDAGGDAATPP